MRVQLSRGAALRFAVAAAASCFHPQASRAWCGERYPSWAYFLKWDELRVPFSVGEMNGECFCRVVGDVGREQKAGVPPVLLVGTPGVGYEYLENLETLTVSDRRVIEVTFAGTEAKAADAAALLTPSACAEQLKAVCAACRLSNVHIVAHGLGAPAALGVAKQAAGGVGVRSLTLVSPYGARSDLRPGAREALSAGASRRARASALIPTVTSSASESCVAEAADGGGGPLLEALLAADGDALGGPALARQLESVAAPTLLVSGGPTDIVDASWTDLPQMVRQRSWAKSGHLPFVDQASRDDFTLDLLAFLDEVDGVATNRELKFADPIGTIKELNTPPAPKDCSGLKTEKGRAYCEAQNAKALSTNARPATP